MKLDLFLSFWTYRNVSKKRQQSWFIARSLLFSLHQILSSEWTKSNVMAIPTDKKKYISIDFWRLHTRLKPQSLLRGRSLITPIDMDSIFYMEFYDAKGHVERFPSISLALEAARVSLHWLCVGKKRLKNLFGVVIKSIFSLEILFILFYIRLYILPLCSDSFWRLSLSLWYTSICIYICFLTEQFEPKSVCVCVFCFTVLSARLFLSFLCSCGLMRLPHSRISPQLFFILSFGYLLSSIEGQVFVVRALCLERRRQRYGSILLGLTVSCVPRLAVVCVCVSNLCIDSIYCLFLCLSVWIGLWPHLVHIPKITSQLLKPKGIRLRKINKHFKSVERKMKRLFRWICLVFLFSFSLPPNVLNTFKSTRNS